MNPLNEEKNSSPAPIMRSAIWWAYLVTAVLAIPSLSYLLTSLLPVSGAIELLIFIIACWLCTYVGMRLMGAPSMSGNKQHDED